MRRFAGITRTWTRSASRAPTSSPAPPTGRGTTPTSGTTIAWRSSSTPATAQAEDLKSRYGLKNHGLLHLDRVYWNLPVPALYEEASFRQEGLMAHGGPFVVNTGKWSARAAQEKYVVRESSTEDKIWWGEYNRPYDPEKFDAFDHWFSTLKGQGIYMTWSCFYPHVITRDDGYPAELFAELPKAGRGRSTSGLVNFMRPLQDAEWEWQRALLLHKNPHTGLRYIDDLLLRDRDTTQQERIPIAKAVETVEQRLGQS